MNPKRILLPLLLVVGLVTGCGSTTTVLHTPPPPSKSNINTFQAVAGHPCDPANFYMQCAAGAPGQQLAPGLTISSGFGIDTWDSPMSASFAASHGVKFALSYLSGTSKDWTYARVHEFINAHIPIGFVFESSSSRAEGGCSAGRSDALNASSELGHLGVAGARFAMAVDTDTSAAAVRPYFQCAASAVGKQRVGVYGSYRVTIGLLPGTVSWAWQTLAWSFGARNGSACLYQANIDRPFYGFQIDPDYVYCSNNGLYPSKPPPPPNAPGCSSPSIKTSYCWDRFTTLDWFNRPAGSKTAKIKPWCYYGCVERSLVKRLTGEIFASQTPAGLKGDLGRAKAVCGRLTYLEQHRSVKENGDTRTYGRKENVCGRSKDIPRKAWYYYLTH